MLCCHQEGVNVGCVDRGRLKREGEREGGRERGEERGGGERDIDRDKDREKGREWEGERVRGLIYRVYAH